MDFQEEECQFKKFGFEKPDFECSVYFRDVSDRTYGLVSISMFYWTKDGACCNSFGNRSEQFDLIPLKKPWYENKDNISKMCLHLPTDQLFIFKGYKNGWIESEIKLHQSGSHSMPAECRPATQEEVLSLVVKET